MTDNCPARSGRPGEWRTAVLTRPYLARHRAIRAAAGFGAAALLISGMWLADRGDAATSGGPPAAVARSHVDIGDAVVLIRSRACGAIAAGSGVVVGGGRLVTARHVVEGSPVILAGGATAGASHLDPVADAAVVSQLNGTPAAMPLARNDARPGDSVTIVGWPNGVRQATVSGRVAMVRHPGELGEGAAVLAITADGVVPGFSGGALVDSSGRLAGIVTAVESPTGLVLAVPVSRLRYLLSANSPTALPSVSVPTGLSRCP